MRPRATRKTVIGFKIDPELAELLNALPNKSEFIRKAIVAQLGVPCPLCNGRGFLSQRVHSMFAPVVEAGRQAPCAICGELVPLPFDPDDLTLEDRHRFDQFLHGGPLYCRDCFASSPTCSQCPWHIAAEQIAAHLLKVHASED